MSVKITDERKRRQRVQLTMNAVEIEELDSIAREMDCNRSEAVRRLAKTTIKTRGKKNEHSNRKRRIDRR